jgi:hypothetical protein
MKKLLVFAVALIMVFSATACSGGGEKIPDVFGIDYVDATQLLEAEGYEVTAIETEIEGISEKLLYPLETVKKGIVFKVDDYIIDGNGNLTQNYNIVRDKECVSNDKKLVIYYAKTDYKSKEDTTESQKDTSSKTTSKQTTSTETYSKEEKPSSSSKADKNDTGISSDFKKAMDSYEKFMNEYVAFMKKYKQNPTDMSLLSDYADYMSDYSDFVADFKKWENADLNSAELSYYLDVQTRVSKKLLEVTM